MEEGEKVVDPEVDVDKKPEGGDTSTETEDATAEAAKTVYAELEETKEKHLRLYAEFENYKKRAQKDKEELIKYSNESLIYEILSVIDSLEMTLKHSAEKSSDSQSLIKGVENTLKELSRILGNFGLVAIAASGKPFDPMYHHAISQVEKEDIESNTIVEEFRKGYLYNEKVLRASLVAVSKKAVS